MGEVKAQAVWRYQRACLAGVLTQHRAQLGVQQVGGGVVAHDVAPALHIHAGNRPVANLGGAAYDRADVDDDASRRLAHLLDVHLPLIFG